MASDQMAIVGTMNYKYQMGVSTMLQYKGITLGVDFDIRQGGKMYSRTKAINYFTGNAIQTAYNDRNPFIVPNSVNQLSDGSFVENTTPVSYAKICDYWNAGGDMMGSYELIDKSFVKLLQYLFRMGFAKEMVIQDSVPRYQGVCLRKQPFCMDSVRQYLY